MSTKRVLLAVFAGLLFVMVVQALVIPYGDDAIADVKDQFVREQNLDANGYIKVHEQGVPSVKLDAAGNTVKLDPVANTVKVQSSRATPVVTRESSGHTPWNWFQSIVVPAGQPYAPDASFTAPADKYLVIEFVSAAANLSDPAFPRVAIHINNRLNDPYWNTYLPVTTEFPANETYGYPIYRLFQLNQQTRLYCEPGCTVTVQVMRGGDDTEPAVVPVTMTGYLTDEM